VETIIIFGDIISITKNFIEYVWNFPNI